MSCFLSKNYDDYYSFLSPVLKVNFHTGKISKWYPTYENKKQKSLFVGQPHKQTFDFLHFGEIPNPLFGTSCIFQK
ncbi:Hypothetical protein SMA_2002 [Streptococcus macedonicus ACA-DC 198]|nr:Hypothetical protein SMA_2002 [Streptococcus macedonicus ACA-DC 198]